MLKQKRFIKFVTYWLIIEIWQSQKKETKVDETFLCNGLQKALPWSIMNKWEILEINRSCLWSCSPFREEQPSSSWSDRVQNLNTAYWDPQTGIQNCNPWNPCLTNKTRGLKTQGVVSCNSIETHLVAFLCLLRFCGGFGISWIVECIHFLDPHISHIGNLPSLALD